jgi:hypothetical protein
MCAANPFVNHEREICEVEILISCLCGLLIFKAELLRMCGANPFVNHEWENVIILISGLFWLLIQSEAFKDVRNKSFRESRMGKCHNFNFRSFLVVDSKRSFKMCAANPSLIFPAFDFPSKIP